jgi:hypothetical protein
MAFNHLTREEIARNQRMGLYAAFGSAPNSVLSREVGSNCLLCGETLLGVGIGLIDFIALGMAVPSKFTATPSETHLENVIGYCVSYGIGRRAVLENMGFEHTPCYNKLIRQMDGTIEDDSGSHEFA